MAFLSGVLGSGYRQKISASLLTEGGDAFIILFEK